MEAHVLQALRFDNPWLDGADLATWLQQRVPAEYYDRQLVLVPDERVCLVVGPRQVGKSTLIWKTLAERGAPVLYLNCEDAAIQEWLGSPAAFLSDADDLAPGATLFFEEVQALAGAGRFLKGVVDRQTGRHIFATGSSAFDLQDRTRESLAGRAQRHRLLPFSVAELSADVPSRILREARQRALLAQVLVSGSYPAVILGRDPQRSLGELVEAFVIRDASDRFQIRDVPALRKLLGLIAGQIGNLCNFSEWASLAGIGNDTVSSYVGLLTDAHIVQLVPPFVGGKRAELTKRPKAFFLDNGVRNTLFGGFAAWSNRADRGALFENYVFGELCRATNPLLHTIRYWRSRSGAEVDFVIEHQGRLLAIEVKAGDPRRALSRSAHSFIEAYRPALFLVVGAVSGEPRAVDGSPVEFIEAIQLSARVAEFLA